MHSDFITPKDSRYLLIYEFLSGRSSPGRIRKLIHLIEADNAFCEAFLAYRDIWLATSLETPPEIFNSQIAWKKPGKSQMIKLITDYASHNNFFVTANNLQTYKEVSPEMKFKRILRIIKIPAENPENNY